MKAMRQVRSYFAEGRRSRLRRSLRDRVVRMQRTFYTLSELEKMGVERQTVRKLIRKRRIRTKKVGRRLHLHPKDVDQEIGWVDEDGQKEAASEPSPWAVKEAEELLR